MILGKKSIKSKQNRKYIIFSKKNKIKKNPRIFKIPQFLKILKFLKFQKMNNFEKNHNFWFFIKKTSFFIKKHGFLMFFFDKLRVFLEITS